MNDFLRQVENIGKREIQEDYDAGVREYSDMLFDMIEEGMVDAESIAKDLIYWCSEDDIKRYMEVNDLISYDDEEEEDFEEEDFEESFYSPLKEETDTHMDSIEEIISDNSKSKAPSKKKVKLDFASYDDASKFCRKNKINTSYIKDNGNFYVECIKTSETDLIGFDLSAAVCGAYRGERRYLYSIKEYISYPEVHDEESLKNWFEEFKTKKKLDHNQYLKLSTVKLSNFKYSEKNTYSELRDDKSNFI